jgi:hypothetical protein
MAKVITDVQSMITPPDPTWHLGSLAAVADEHSLFMLKSDGTWENVIV